jgi:uncharacterized protein (UPF0305 family)
MFRINRSNSNEQPVPGDIQNRCSLLAAQNTRGELGQAIAALVLACSPQDIREMRWNFSEKIRDYPPEYREKLEEMINAHLSGTYQTVRLMNQQGTFLIMNESVAAGSAEYWMMVSDTCSRGDNSAFQLRFLKYLLSGFCMLVLLTPGHPVGMPFPGGEKVDLIDGIYYCPVRTKANDVDAALCPFCPALQTPEIGYLKPPVNASKHRKQEFIRNCYDHHHFNG